MTPGETAKQRNEMSRSRNPLKARLFAGALAAAAILALQPAVSAAPQEPQPAGKTQTKPHVKELHPHLDKARRDKASAQKTTADSKAAKSDPGADPAKTGPETPAEPPASPYEPQVLRLAEILGALAYLDDLCGSKSDWRGKMQAFLAAEAKTTERKERLAGTFNRSFHDYEKSYAVCTPNAQIIISRYLAEAGRLSREVVDRFRSS